MVVIKTKSARETQKVASLLAQEISRALEKRAQVIALEGELGSGKTTFIQGFARALGVKERVLSPTFVLLKIYKVTSRQARRINPPTFSQGIGPREKDLKTPPIPAARPQGIWEGGGIKFRHLIHVDCYRLESPEELLHLGLHDLLKDKDAIILIEWADRVQNIIPRDAIWLRFAHGKRPYEREIQIFNFQ